MAVAVVRFQVKDLFAAAVILPTPPATKSLNLMVSPRALEATFLSEIAKEYSVSLKKHKLQPLLIYAVN